jgi:hypothetical protein
MEIAIPDPVSQSLERTKYFLTQTAAKSGNSFTEVTENAKTSLEASIKKAENLRFSLTDSIEAGLTSFVNNWFNDHPILFWILNHPIYDLGILLVVIFLFWGLLKAIGRLVEKAWIFVIIAPFKLIQSFLGIGSKSLGNVMTSGLVTVPSNQTLNQGDRKQDAANIINQLNALKQHQEKLLQELATILESEDLKVK